MPWQLPPLPAVGTAGTWHPGAELSVMGATDPWSFLFSKPWGTADGVQTG